MTFPAVLQITFVMTSPTTGRAELVYATPQEGVAEFHVTDWHRVTDGVLRGTLTHIPHENAPDPRWEAFLAGLLGLIDG